MLGEAIDVVGLGVDGAKGHIAEQHAYRYKKRKSFNRFNRQTGKIEYEQGVGRECYRDR